MGVISFASLKGGVGKTSVAVNVAHALAKRGCKALLLDLDPSSHASRLLSPNGPDARKIQSAARFLASSDDNGSLSDRPLSNRILIEGVMEHIMPARENLSMLQGAEVMKELATSLGNRAYKVFFEKLIGELHVEHDYVIIDCAPMFNIILRSALANSNLVVVPVDSGAMSIHSLEELVDRASDIKGPAWSILRVMVNRQASRIRAMAEKRLHAQLSIRASGEIENEPEEQLDIDDPDQFIRMLMEQDPEMDAKSAGVSTEEEDQSPIFLLNSLIFRSEQQNRLSFMSQTSFDSRETKVLAEQYSSLARELEQVLAMVEEAEPETNIDGLLSVAMQATH